MITALTASKAYAAAQKAMGVDPGQEAASAVAPGGFGDFLKNAMTDAMQASKNAETQIVNHTQGKAQLIDVATAISAASSIDRCSAFSARDCRRRAARGRHMRVSSRWLLNRSPSPHASPHQDSSLAPPANSSRLPAAHLQGDSERPQPHHLLV